MCLLLVTAGCATGGSPGLIPVDRKVCVAAGAAVGGTVGYVIANNNRGHHEDRNRAATAAAGAAAGGALGALLCGKGEQMPPTVSASASPTRGEAPLSVDLSAAAEDPEGQIQSYEWDLGDGTMASGARVRHSYAEPGDYVARVTVTGKGGLTASDSARVSVAQAEAPAPPPPPVVPTRRIVLRGVNFDFDRSEIRPQDAVVLDAGAEVLNENPEVKAEVAGHTDSVGPEAYNQGLSEARARAVVDYLVGQGVDRERLRPVGYGETRPVADNGTSEGRDQNRRVEFVIR
jgi:outer membrane protein OmpA-like peptidoglycan-associated protein